MKIDYIIVQRLLAVAFCMFFLSPLCAASFMPQDSLVANEKKTHEEDSLKETKIYNTNDTTGFLLGNTTFLQDSLTDITPTQFKEISNLKTEEERIEGLLMPTKTQQHANFDFLAILFLLCIPVGIKLLRPNYYVDLFSVLRNPGMKYEKIRGVLYNNYFSLIFLDLYFCISFGYYFFFITRLYRINIFPEWVDSIWQISIHVIFFALIYVVKYLAVKFVGWLLRIEEQADGYNYNVLFFNKITSFLLIPFIIIIAFGKGEWVNICVAISFIIILLSFINRSFRSDKFFTYFSKLSKFYFFMYLCAFELLPLAILYKIVSDIALH